MTVVITNLQLGRYDVDELKQLYKMQLISKGELINELVDRGCDEWLAVQIARSVSVVQHREAI